MHFFQAEAMRLQSPQNACTHFHIKVADPLEGGVHQHNTLIPCMQRQVIFGHCATPMKLEWTIKLVLG